MAAQVEVASVRFSNVRPEGGRADWMEAEVELDVKPGGKAVTGEYVDRVRTTLSLMVDGVDSHGQKRSAFYRASAEAITLEGGKASIRFYLPPEVLKRDRVRSDIKFYTVDLTAGGAAQPASKAATAADFKGPDSIKNFQAQVAAGAGANENVLMPQYLTPFSYEQRQSPTLLRREPQR